jgi:hypothetical protein
MKDGAGGVCTDLGRAKRADAQTGDEAHLRQGRWGNECEAHVQRGGWVVASTHGVKWTRSWGYGVSWGSTRAVRRSAHPPASAAAPSGRTASLPCGLSLQPSFRQPWGLWRQAQGLSLRVLLSADLCHHGSGRADEVMAPCSTCGRHLSIAGSMKIQPRGSAPILIVMLRWSDVRSPPTLPWLREGLVACSLLRTARRAATVAGRLTKLEQTAPTGQITPLSALHPVMAGGRVGWLAEQTEAQTQRKTGARG